MAENPTQEGVAAEGGETFDNTVLYNTDSEILIDLLQATQTNGDMRATPTIIMTITALL